MGVSLMSSDMVIKSYRGDYFLSYYNMDNLLGAIDKEENFFVLDKEVDRLYPNIKQNISYPKLIVFSYSIEQEERVLILSTYMNGYPLKVKLS